MRRKWSKAETVEQWGLDVRQEDVLLEINGCVFRMDKVMCIRIGKYLSSIGGSQ